MNGTELTVRGLVLGAVIAMGITAANIYLGLRVGVTFAASIPAAVISMSVLRAFKTGSLRESNIVTTVASSGGMLSVAIFLLPTLVMIGHWTRFPYWTTFLICSLGGVLGVLFSIPLRRQLVGDAALPFPEGVATAAVLRAGARGDEASPNALEREKGPMVVLWGAIASFAMQYILTTGVTTSTFTRYFRVGLGASGVDFGFSLALLGAGHLMGLSVGAALMVGLLIAWAGFIPVWTQGVPGEDLAAIADAAWRNVRFVGVGALGIAGIWGLIKLIYSASHRVFGFLGARRAAAAPTRSDHTRDIPGAIVLTLIALCLASIGYLLWQFINGNDLGQFSSILTTGGLLFVVVVGFLAAIIAAYMAALVGAWNSPVSSIGILSTLFGALLLTIFVKPLLDASSTAVLMAFCLFAVSIVFSVATISNDNLQNMKTGLLVGASPWKQQLALIVGVIASSLVIPPALNLMNQAYGFLGDPNRQTIAEYPLVAPQATLISVLVPGVMNDLLDWNLIGIGALVGVACIIADELLGIMKLMRLPPLAVAIGIYLPMSLTQPVILGALAGWLYNRLVRRKQNGEGAIRLGVLMASGLVIGEGVLGLVNGAIVLAAGDPSALAMFAGRSTNPWPGAICFVALAGALYAWVSGQSDQHTKQTDHSPASAVLPPISIDQGQDSRSKIFVSYRRADTEAVCGRLCDRLMRAFGKNKIFVDIDSIPYGVNFTAHIRRVLSECRVCLVLIGPDWVGAGPDGNRIAQDTDFVRAEIEEALRQGIKIVPILVGHTQMPSAHQLPGTIQEIVHMNAAPLDQGRDFDVHANRLIKSLRARK